MLVSSNIHLNQTQIFPKPPSISSHPQPPKNIKFKPITISASSSSITQQSSISNDTNHQTKKKFKVKKIERPRVVLKFIWMEKNIGIALDQMIAGYGSVPLSTYYFWPRKDAWEELKVLLESKAWISNKQKVVLLNQATDIINLWQQSGDPGEGNGTSG